VTDRPKTIAVALLSGGLDSILAAKVILEQGITIVGVNFAGAYCPRPLTGKTRAEKAAEQLGIELVTLPMDVEFIAMVKNPRHGRGKNMNPCIDCHTLMIRKAWEYGRTRGADFVITGEVLGQRPMSQNRQALNTVARESGVEGRQRTRQMGLAKKYGIKDYPTPAGGCLLTERVFSKRLAEAFDHGEDSLEMVELLSLGRHFRLPSGARLVVGRDETENDELMRRKPAGAVVIDAGDLPGPVGLVILDSRLQIADCRARADEDTVLAARICARYSDERKEPTVKVKVAGEEITVQPAGEEETARLLIA
jgi:tRNA-specific 2-thiouridylase